MYIIYTTCPDVGSKNVGDKLIEVRTKELIKEIKGDNEFITIFREESLEDNLSDVNNSRAILMPAFAIRNMENFYPDAYRLVDDLEKIKVPIIPVGSNWNAYPGDKQTLKNISYSQATKKFIKYISSNTSSFSCREYNLMKILEQNGINNGVMTGDPAWFHLPSIGKPMKRPKEINRIVFSPPLSPYYLEQAKSIITMLAEMFPRAEKYCAMHLADSGISSSGPIRGENSAAMTHDVAKKNHEIREFSKSYDFTVMEMAGDIHNLDFYETCDLHVGYECHAHLFFFSHRIPSVLIAEDARGIGFNYTLGFGGFTGFVRAQYENKNLTKTHTSGYSTTVEEISLAPPRNDIDDAIRKFLAEELDSGFARYIGLDTYLDTVYSERMKPFIESLP